MSQQQSAWDAFSTPAQPRQADARQIVPPTPNQPPPPGPYDAENQEFKRNAEARDAATALREIDKSDPQLTNDEKLGIRQDMRTKIAGIDRLKKMSKNDIFATGFGAETMAKVFPASSAGRVKAGVVPIGAIGALGKLLEMAKANGGRNPLTPLSNADLVLMEKSIDNLDPTQADPDFQRALDTYRDLFLRLFKGAGGATNRTGRRSGRPSDIDAIMKKYGAR